MSNEYFQFVVKVLSIDKEILGTGFFCGENCIFTARHVVEKHLDQGVSDFKYELNDKTVNLAKKIYENIDYDIVVLETSSKHDTIKIPPIAYSVAEVDDRYEVAGYPFLNEGGMDIISGYVLREECLKPTTIFGLYIENQRENANWEGLSGAPVIIENEIAGMVLKTEEGNQKPRILAESIDGMLSVIDADCSTILKKIKMSYSPLILSRFDDFSEQLNHIFNFSEFYTLYGHIDMFILKNSEKIIDLVNLVINAVEYYGITLTEYKNSQSDNPRTKREADKSMRVARSNILEVLLKENHVAYIILWVLIEGFKKIPRIGTRINTSNKYLSTDIYVHDDTINIYFSEAIKEIDFLNCIKALVEKIDTYIQDGKFSLEYEIIEYDEVVLSNLSYHTRKKLYNLKDNPTEKINVGIYSLVLFEYFDIYKRGVSENEQVQKKILTDLIKSLNIEIRTLVEQYDWIGSVDIKYFTMPLSDFTLFENKINDLLIAERSPL